MAQLTASAGISAHPGVPAPSQWLFVVAGAAGLVGYLIPAVRRVGYPYELSFFEGSTVEVTGRLLDGLSLYGPPSAQFTPWPYPPLYFWVTSAVADLMGLSLPALRWVSFVASIVVLVLVGVVARRLTGSTAVAVLAAGLYAATYRVAGAWADTARVDSLLLALLMAAVVVAMRARTWWGGVAVGLLVVAAFLTKQNAAIAAAPMLVALVVRRPRVGAVAAAVAVVGGVGSVVVGEVVTDGWYAPYVVSQLLGHDARLQWLAYLPVVDVLAPFALIVVAVVVTAYRHRAGLLARRPHRLTDEEVVVAGAVIGLLLAALAGRLHDGGSANVAMPAHLATALMLAVALGRLVSSGLVGRAEQWIIGTLVLGNVLLLQFWLIGIVPTSADRAAGDAFIAALAELPGPVVVASHPHYARLAGGSPAASTIPVVDLLDTRSTKARNSLIEQLPWTLDGVNTLVVDNEATSYLFGPALDRDFTLVDEALITGEDFIPVTDVPVRPTRVYVRTTELAR